jgi:plasmid stabilization system protein ParE
MRIRWTRAAAEDLEHIKDYLTEHHPQFAQSTVIELYETIRSLKTSPRPRTARTRRGNAPTGVAAPALYRGVPHQDETVEVLHIFHGVQNRP